MNVRIHPHAMTRCLERGAKEPEVIDTVLTGHPFPAKYGRFGFRKQFTFNAIWNNHFFESLLQNRHKVGWAKPYLAHRYCKMMGTK